MESYLNGNSNSKMDEILALTKKLTNPSLMEDISKIALPEILNDFIETYKKIGGQRDPFLWKWVFENLHYYTLSSVAKSERENIITLKTLLTIFVAIFDDMADVDKDVQTIYEMQKVPHHVEQVDMNRISEKNRQLFALSLDIWRYFIAAIREYANFFYFENMLFFDVKQMINSFLYFCIVNENPSLMSYSESANYGNHNMMMMIYCDIDLMASQHIINEEVPLLREIFWRGQKMGRIGNWLTTWKREIKDDDFSSGIFAYQIVNHELSPPTTLQHKSNIEESINNSQTEDHFFAEWQRYHDEIKTLGQAIQSIDVSAYLWALENLLTNHILSSGLK